MENSFPITQYRKEIVSSVSNNPVTIVVAETGAGKSTQVPQYLLAAGYDVVVTQPRRLAAQRLAERVAEEVDCDVGELIGYRTAVAREDSTATQCLFITDGLQLVRELMAKKTENNSTRVLVIDEVHEWNLNIEILVAWAALQISKLSTFKVVIMSATLDVEALVDYYKKASVITVPGRLFPIEERKSRGRPAQEVAQLVSEGRNVLVFQPGKGEIRQAIQEISQLVPQAVVLPLHGEMDPAEQRKCFARYNKPKVVVATNVAQTSVTIEDIDAVVDTGIERRTELQNGIEGLYLKPISRADAKQRAGRAGRTRPGIYVDMSSGQDRPAFPVPEIVRVRLDQTVLRMAASGLDMEELRFFHQPPIEEIRRAKKTLARIGCLDEKMLPTEVGRRVARFPLSVQYGRMLVEAERRGVVREVTVAAAILESGGISSRVRRTGEIIKNWKALTGQETESDILAEVIAFLASQKLPSESFESYGISQGGYKRAKEIHTQLRNSLKGHGIEHASTGGREEILLSVCSGMVDHLFQVVKTSQGEKLQGDGLRIKAPESTVVTKPGDWVSGIPFDLGRGGTVEHRVQMLTHVSIEMLTEIAPQLFERRVGIDPRIDYERKQVVSMTEVYFGDRLIKKDVVEEVEIIEEWRILLVEHCYKSFRYPRLGDIVIKKNTKVPTIRKVVVGKDPKTKQDLVAWGVYEKRARREVLRAIWVRSEEEASKTLSQTQTEVTRVLTLLERSSVRDFSTRKNEQERTVTSETLKHIDPLRSRFKEVNNQRLALGLSPLQLFERCYAEGGNLKTYTEERLAALIREVDLIKAINQMDEKSPGKS